MKTMMIFFVLYMLSSAGGEEIGGIILEPPGNVTVTRREWTWRSGAAREEMPVVSVLLHSGRFLYELRHDRKYGNGRIGLSSPGGYNWFQTGMMSISINGERFKLLPGKNAKIEVKEGEIGQAMFSWENEVTVLHLNFFMFTLDNKLFMEAALEPKVELDDVRISFSNFPAGHPRSPERDLQRVIYTPERTIRERGTFGLKTPEENWILLTDDSLDYQEHPQSSQGPSAIAYLTDRFSRIEFRHSSWNCVLELEADADARNFLFALWEFPHKTNREAVESFEGLVGDAFEKMRGLASDD